MLAVLSLVLSGTGQLTAFVGVVVLLGAFLFVVTRRTTDALEASTYEDEEAEGGRLTTRSAATSRCALAPSVVGGPCCGVVWWGFGASISSLPSLGGQPDRPSVGPIERGSWSRSSRS